MGVWEGPYGAAVLGVRARNSKISEILPAVGGDVLWYFSYKFLFLREDPSQVFDYFQNFSVFLFKLSFYPIQHKSVGVFLKDS